MNKMNERDILLIWLENIFYELHKNNLDCDAQFHIKQTDNFYEIKEKCKPLAINLIQITKDNIFKEKNTRLLCFIEIEYKKLYCIFCIIGNMYYLNTIKSNYTFTEKEFFELYIKKILIFEK